MADKRENLLVDFRKISHLKACLLDRVLAVVCVIWRTIWRHWLSSQPSEHRKSARLS